MASLPAFWGPGLEPCWGPETFSKANVSKSTAGLRNPGTASQVSRTRQPACWEPQNWLPTIPGRSENTWNIIVRTLAPITERGFQKSL